MIGVCSTRQVLVGTEEKSIPGLASHGRAEWSTQHGACGFVGCGLEGCMDVGRWSWSWRSAARIGRMPVELDDARATSQGSTLVQSSMDFMED